MAALFVRYMRASLKDEVDAAAMYSRMIKLAKGMPHAQQVLTEIRNDERDHYRLLVKLSRELGL